MADNTRWLHPKGKIHISKADGNLYMHDLDTNRVKVAQLDRLIDIRTDRGSSAVVIDTGHTITSTVLHGFQFKTQEARDKFIADVMEVLVGNVPYLIFPSEPKVVNAAPTPVAEQPDRPSVAHWVLAVSVVQKYLSELAERWRRMCPDVTKNLNSWSLAEDHALRPAESADIERIIELVYLAEDIIIEATRRPVTRPDEARDALTLLEALAKKHPVREG